VQLGQKFYITFFLGKKYPEYWTTKGTSGTAESHMSIVNNKDAGVDFYVVNKRQTRFFLNINTIDSDLSSLMRHP